MSIVIGIISEGDSISSGTISHPFMGLSPLPENHAAQSWWTFETNGLLGTNMAWPASRLNSNGPSTDFPGDLTYRASLVDTIMAGKTSAPLRETGRAESRATRKYIFSVMIGTNPDTSNYTTQATNVGNYLLARRAAGADKVIVGTILPRGDGILDGSQNGVDTNFEIYRQGYNAIIRGASWKSTYQVDGIFDFGAEPTVGAPGAWSNKTYYPDDNIHPGVAAYALLTPLYIAAVYTVKATL